MGRNSTPKLGEWRGGKLYRFRTLPDTDYPRQDNGAFGRKARGDELRRALSEEADRP